eukprot:1740284-Rhodomonas_salina.1
MPHHLSTPSSTHTFLSSRILAPTTSAASAEHTLSPTKQPCTVLYTLSTFKNGLTWRIDSQPKLAVAFAQAVTTRMLEATIRQTEKHSVYDVFALCFPNAIRDTSRSGLTELEHNKALENMAGFSRLRFAKSASMGAFCPGWINYPASDQVFNSMTRSGSGELTSVLIDSELVAMGSGFGGAFSDQGGRKGRRGA